MSTISIDISLVVQIFLFLALWFGLKRLIVDPTLAVLAERTRRTTGTQRAADDIRAAAERDADACEAQLQQVRHALAGETAAARAAIAADERRLLSAAREEASTQLVELREHLAREAAEARPVLTAEARTLGLQMFGRVVGRPAA